MHPGNRNPILQPHQLREHLRPLNHRNLPRPSLHHLRIVLGPSPPGPHPPPAPPKKPPPRPPSRSVGAAPRKSDPETAYPIVSRISAIPLIPIPPTPIKCTRCDGANIACSGNPEVFIAMYCPTLKRCA